MSDDHQAHTWCTGYTERGKVGVAENKGEKSLLDGVRHAEYLFKLYCRSLGQSVCADEGRFPQKRRATRSDARVARGETLQPCRKVRKSHVEFEDVIRLAYNSQGMASEHRCVLQVRD